MISITCDKCRRRFTPTSDEIQVYLAESQGQKHTQVPCPHCGKANKVRRSGCARPYASPPRRPHQQKTLLHDARTHAAGAQHRSPQR